MSKFEIIVHRGREAERVTTAFYRFLELKTVSADEVATLQTEILGDTERRTVQLWSEEAVCDFEHFLRGFSIDAPSGVSPSIRKFAPRAGDAHLRAMRDSARG